MLLSLLIMLPLFWLRYFEQVSTRDANTGGGVLVLASAAGTAVLSAATHYCCCKIYLLLPSNAVTGSSFAHWKQ
jgi:short-subunit dehydrogenase